MIFHLQGPHRAQHQLSSDLDRDQAGGRHGEVALPQVHGLHDAPRGELRHPEEEEDRGLRHQLPHHQLPHGRDVPAQADRLRRPVHGGDRQGDLGDEALRQLEGENMRRGVPQAGK